MKQAGAVTEDLVRELASYSDETEWLEFKVNNEDPEKIGRYVSAISNSALLSGRPFGYLVWGVDDSSHKVVGTTVTSRSLKKGNEEFVNWLVKLLEPSVDVKLHRLLVGDKHVVVLRIAAAVLAPVAFKRTRYVRRGSYLKKLDQCPEKERLIWDRLKGVTFEQTEVSEVLDPAQVLKLLDIAKYLELSKRDFPDSRQDLLDCLEGDRLINRHRADAYSVTGLGAIAFAKDLNSFSRGRRRRLRITFHDSYGRTDSADYDKICARGYVVGFSDWVDLINDRLPFNENIAQDSMRREVRTFPKKAVRELLANALVHQSLTAGNEGPRVEVFWDRIEITNPGEPLVTVDRMLDLPPESRNDELAGLFRRLGLCEERGSGIDKVVEEAENFRLPPPKFEELGSRTRATLFASSSPLEAMTESDLARACQQHAALRWELGKQGITLETLKVRFSREDPNQVTPDDDDYTGQESLLEADAESHRLASAAIEAAVAARLIKPVDVLSTSYVPVWASL